MAEESPSGWNLNLDANPLAQDASCPSPVVLLRRKDKPGLDAAFLRQVSHAYWRHLLQCLHGKAGAAGAPRGFTLLERLYFDWGIWCGEQFEGDPKVREILHERGDLPPKRIYQAVFEELLEACSGELRAEEPAIRGITGWLARREEVYRAIGDAERFSVSREFLSRLPPECAEYFNIREERLAVLQRLAGPLEKLPGMHGGLFSLIQGGIIHDELDFLLSKKLLDGESTRKKANLSALWNGVATNLLRLFPDLAKGPLADLADLSGRAVRFCRERQTDVANIREMARQAYRGEKESVRRLARDVQLLKNNLNLGSMRKSKTPHCPLALSWPEPLDLGRLGAVLGRLAALDHHFPGGSDFLLAPGDFHGFYEFDRETIILPLYAAGQEEDQCLRALVDYRFSLETIRGGSELLEDLKTTWPDRAPRESFRALYAAWFHKGATGDPAGFAPGELDLLLKHVSPSPRTLFLRAQEYEVDNAARLRILEEIRTTPLAADRMHVIAGQFYREGKLAEALDWMVKAAQAAPGVPRVEVALCALLVRMKHHGPAGKILRRYADRPDAGPPGFFARRMLQALGGSGA